MKNIYLDHGATSFPKAPGVADAVYEYMTEVGANISRGTYASAISAASVVLETREMLMKLFNFNFGSEYVVFTPGVTFGLNQILRGCVQPGDHVVVSSLEHNAVMRPLVDMEKSGVTFSRIPADEDGITDPRDIEPLIRDNTALMVICHASNVCGTIFPLKEAAEVCRKHHIPLVVDASQTAGHYPIDFEELGLAALCVPGHKGLLGPQGIGATLFEPSFAADVRPLVMGGTGSFSDSEEMPVCMPDKFESGTMNLPGIYGLNAALKYTLKETVEKRRRQEMELTGQFIEGLSDAHVRICGTKDLEKRVGVVSLDFEYDDNAQAAYYLDSEFGIRTRTGMHCAPNAHKTIGTFPQGTVRFSFGYGTTAEDVEYAAYAVREVAE